MGKPAVQTLQQLRVKQALALFLGRQQQLQHSAGALYPFGRRGLASQQFASLRQSAQQRGQAAQSDGVQPADFVVRLNLVPGIALPHRKAQQHAAQAKAPAVGFARVGQANAGALRAVQAPAHASAFDPAVQKRHLGLGNAKALAHRINGQQIQYLADGKAPLRHGQHMLQGHQQRRPATLALVGHGVGDVARIAARNAAKNGFDMWRVHIDVRHHDDDVARRQRAVGIHARQQLVVQHLHLTLRAVRSGKADGAVTRRV